MKYIVNVDDQEYIIEIGKEGKILVNDEPYDVDFQRMPGSGVTSLLLNHRSLEAVVEEKDGFWEVLIRGELYPVTVEDERTYRLARARGTFAGPDGEALVRSPMPGIVIAVPVAVGDAVNKGDTVIILESMKMENELRAPLDGVIHDIRVEPGASVEKNQPLVMVSEKQE
ncbi:MAG: biotin/lipoyl-containing protein [Candidatus Promineifilaceae bacterium]|nr:biotin/lipoyl-containing protein [Candidatus Promineifilaceae bacterium]